MIRHATSTSNKASQQMAEEARQTKSGYLPVSRWLEVYGDDSLIDARLTSHGVE